MRRLQQATVGAIFIAEDTATRECGSFAPGEAGLPAQAIEREP